ncbi:MAG: POTRA domain-containing protein [Spirochaetaceae bacterium]
MGTLRPRSSPLSLGCVAGLILASAPISAETGNAPPAEPTAATIGSIEFEGNRRTKEAVLRRAVGAEAGDHFDAATVEQIEDDLKSLGLFSNVEVESRPVHGGPPGEVEVLITVEERWTLVPIPFFGAGSSGLMGGLFVFESNFLGYNKQLIAGGTYADDGFGGLLVYSDPAVLNSNWLLVTTFSAGREEVETADAAFRDRWTYAADQGGVGGTVGYRFEDGLSVRAGADYRYLEVTDTGEPDIVGTGSHAFATFRAEFGFSRTEPEEFFDSGHTLEASAEATPGESAWGLGVAATRNGLVAGSHRLGLRLQSAYGDRPFLLTPRLGGRPTQRTLTPGTVAENSYISQEILYELPLFRLAWGTISLVGFYEGGYLGEADAIYHGGGGGARLYLSRVTFPAVGFDLAWNAVSDYLVFSFSLGGRI